MFTAKDWWLSLILTLLLLVDVKLLTDNKFIIGMAIVVINRLEKDFGNTD